MKYRQWKKNYKKKYGYNPPIEIDKRQQRKADKKALVKEIQEEISNTEGKTIELKAIELKAIVANDLKQGLCKAVAVMCESLRIIFQKAGEVMTDTADRYNTIAERYSILAAVYNQSNKESEAINERE